MPCCEGLAVEESGGDHVDAGPAPICNVSTLFYDGATSSEDDTPPPLEDADGQRTM